MKKVCPIIKSECLEHGCEFYTHLVGKNPQTGADQDEWGCAIKWLPILLVENAAQMRKATASTDKVATQVARHHSSFIAILPDEARQRLLDADPHLKKLSNESTESVVGNNGERTGDEYGI